MPSDDPATPRLIRPRGFPLAYGIHATVCQCIEYWRRRHDFLSPLKLPKGGYEKVVADAWLRGSIKSAQVDDICKGVTVKGGAA